MGRDAELAVDTALDWLVAQQEPSGELMSYASALGIADPEWVPDSLKFISALGALALSRVDDPRARSIIDRIVEFLQEEREPRSLWRYWTRQHERFDYTPPDADDTACCSMAVELRGADCSANVPLLLANRDGHGRFYTWLIPHGLRGGPRYLWTVRDEFRRSTKRRRAELWANSEAWPGDVDAVVNANVIRYLGPRWAPPEAVAWVAQTIHDHREDDCDSWHRNRYTMYASIADGHRRGIEAYEQLGPVIVGRIAERVDGVEGVGPPLDTAFALVAVLHFEGPTPLAAELAGSLTRRQQADGSWERSVFYYGGPDEVFGWASEALSTAVAVQALSEAGRAGVS